MMYVPTSRRRRGVGAVTTQQAVGAATSAAATGAAFIPVVGPIVSGAIALVGTIVNTLLNSGCGQTCIVTSDWANQASDALAQNVQAYMSLPTPRSYTDQQAALANFDKIWAYLVQECSNPSLGKAGQNCIADRQRGACKWKTSMGSCFDWFMAYRDPIANDTNVAPASAATQAVTSVGAVLSSATGIPTWMLAVAGLALLLVMVKT